MKTGDIVVCVNDTYTEEQIKMIPNRPVKGESYTVDEVLITRNGKGVTLVEIDNPPLPHPSGLGTFQASFSVSRFRVMDEVPEFSLTLQNEAV
jgi:hypothetical protein